MNYHMNQSFNNSFWRWFLLIIFTTHLWFSLDFSHGFPFKKWHHPSPQRAPRHRARHRCFRGRAARPSPSAQPPRHKLRRRFFFFLFVSVVFWLKTTVVECWKKNNLFFVWKTTIIDFFLFDKKTCLFLFFQCFICIFVLSMKRTGYKMVIIIVSKKVNSEVREWWDLSRIVLKRTSSGIEPVLCETNMTTSTNVTTVKLQKSMTSWQVWILEISKPHELFKNPFSDTSLPVSSPSKTSSLLQTNFIQDFETLKLLNKTIWQRLLPHIPFFFWRWFQGN